LWDLRTGEEIRRFTGHTAGVRGVTVMPNGDRLVSASIDGTLRIWDVATGEQLHCHDGHGDWVNRAAVTPDGQYILSSSDSAAQRPLMLTSTATGAPVVGWNGHQDWVIAVAVTPDGRHAISASGDETLHLWDLPAVLRSDPRRIRPVCAFTADDALSACAVAPDSRTILVGDHSGRIHRLLLHEPTVRGD
jgi:WD40 repeat protein